LTFSLLNSSVSARTMETDQSRRRYVSTMLVEQITTCTERPSQTQKASPQLGFCLDFFNMHFLFRDSNEF
jgi:hypothetical protein